MKTNKFLLGGIAGGIAFFFLGWLIYGVFLADFMQSNYDASLNRAEEDMIWWALIVANLAMGFLFAQILIWSNSKSLVDGAKVGGIIGILFGLNMDLSFYSMSTMFNSFMPVVVDILIFTIMSAIIGAIIVWAMNFIKEKA